MDIRKDVQLYEMFAKRANAASGAQELNQERVSQTALGNQLQLDLKGDQFRSSIVFDQPMSSNRNSSSGKSTISQQRISQYMSRNLQKTMNNLRQVKSDENQVQRRKNLRDPQLRFESRCDQLRSQNKQKIELIK